MNRLLLAFAMNSLLGCNRPPIPCEPDHVVPSYATCTRTMLRSTSTGPNGYQIRREYDELGLPIHEQRVNESAGIDVGLDWIYDEDHALVSVVKDSDSDNYSAYEETFENEDCLLQSYRQVAPGGLLLIQETRTYSDEGELLVLEGRRDESALPGRNRERVVDLVPGRSYRLETEWSEGRPSHQVLEADTDNPAPVWVDWSWSSAGDASTAVLSIDRGGDGTIDDTHTIVYFSVARDQWTSIQIDEGADGTIEEESRYTYDDRNQLVESISTTAGAASRTRTYTYEGDRLVSRVDGGLEDTYSYDCPSL